MFLKLIKCAYEIRRHIEAFSIRSINRFIVICAFLASITLCVENLKLRILSLRASRKINEDRLKNRTIRTLGEEDTTF